MSVNSPASRSRIRAVRSLTDQMVRSGISGRWNGLIYAGSFAIARLHLRSLICDCAASLAQPTYKPHCKRQNDAEQQASDDRKIERAAPTFDGNVTWEAAKAQRQTSAEEQH